MFLGVDARIFDVIGCLVLICLAQLVVRAIVDRRSSRSGAGNMGGVSQAARRWWVTLTCVVAFVLCGYLADGIFPAVLVALVLLGAICVALSSPQGT